MIKNETKIGGATMEATKKLDELEGMAFIIAKAMIKEHGSYTCMMDGVKTIVTE